MVDKDSILVSMIEMIPVGRGVIRLLNKWDEADKASRLEPPFGDRGKYDRVPENQQEAWLAEFDRRAHSAYVYLHIFGKEAAPLCHCMFRLGLLLDEEFLDESATTEEISDEVDDIYDNYVRCDVDNKYYYWMLRYKASEMKRITEKGVNLLEMISWREHIPYVTADE